MKVINWLLLVGVLFAPFFVSPIHAQDENCDAELLANLEVHEIAIYLFDEIARPPYSANGNALFDRRNYVVAIIAYSNKLVIEEDTCGLGTQARLLSWAFEVYRIKGNMRMGLIDATQYTQQQQALFNMRDDLYVAYCTTYPIACENGVPLSYEVLVEKVQPTPQNGAS